MFQLDEQAPPPRKRPRSMGLLLFTSVMMLLATALLVRDLATGPNPLWVYAGLAAPPPTPSDAPVEVIFLDEEEPEAPAAPAPAPGDP